MPATGSACPDNATYMTGCVCKTYLTCTPGMYFPSCLQCGKPVEWHRLSPEEESERYKNGLFGK